MSPNPQPAIPALFLERMSRLLGDEYAAFAAALEQKPVGGLRVNTLKLTPEAFARLSPFPLGEKVAWCGSAFSLLSTSMEEREKAGEPGKHPYHLAGLYYLQDPSAMAPAELLMGAPYGTNASPAFFSPSSRPASSKGMRVLDLAAAPGGKTTALASLMQGHGLLVANEIKDKRIGHLAVNVERWGAGNVVITNETPERLADHFGAFFDRVLVDAPCSGEGMFRKDMDARRDWSPEMVAGCAVRQRAILRVAAKLVRPGGYLLYSTCTFAPEEDEEVISGLLHGFADKDGSAQYDVVALPQLPGFMPGQPGWLTKAGEAKGLEGAVRLFPHRIAGEGHFACLLRRTGSGEGEAGGASDRMARPSPAQARLWKEFSAEGLKTGLPAERLRVRAERLYFVPEEMPDFGPLRVLHPGVWLGTFKKERFEPAHPLALFLRPGEAIKELPLSSSDVGDESSGHRPPLRAYLRGESLPNEGAPGWTLVSVDGWPLGWGKRVQGVLKNHYPRGWQIYS